MVLIRSLLSALLIFAGPVLPQQVRIPGPGGSSGGGTPVITPGTGAVGTSGTATCTTGTLTITAGNMVVAEVSTGVSYAGNTYTPALLGGVQSWNQFSTSPYHNAAATNLKTYWWAIASSTYTGTTFSATGTNSNPWLTCIVQQWTSSTGWKGAPVDKQATADISVTAPACGGGRVTISTGTTPTTSQAVELLAGMFSTSIGGDYVADGTFTQNQFQGSTGVQSQLESASSSSAGAFTAQADVCDGAGGAMSGVGIIVTMMPN